jgi:6-pyruvoyltetrahydropterin/6-carboxytetrahydropterin synthase
MHEIRKSYRFEAAHFLPRLPKTHPCGRVHGHSFKVGLIARGELDPEMGWVVDFAVLDEGVAPLLRSVDHALLNDVAGHENPTSELLATWFYERLRPGIRQLHQVVVSETCDSETVYPA